MALRLLLAAVVSAVLMFLWGFVYWGPVLNMTARLMEPLPADREMDILAPMRAGEMPTGMYVYPGPLVDPRDEAAAAEWERKVEEGPIFHLAYRRSGASPMDPVMFATGLLHNFVVALLAAGLLAMVVHTLPSYASRVGLLMLASLIAAVWTSVGAAIWWAHTARYAAGQMAYELGAGLAMALATAAIVKPPAAAR
ncbi:MAG: hypothetical protein DCC67_12615 [Planctomycetota bacterium]|nr:MAG: hypothetical protein DCC67_12615 [Planctomycetota bacterium]